MTKKIPTAIFGSLAMLMLILDSKTALSGGIEGLKVCLMTVIPSLLPFFVLSILLTSTLSGLQLKFLRPIGGLCKMPPGAEPLLLLGLLGGYPAGAQAVAQTYREGQLTQKDARRLLGFCSNAGPAFLFGIAALAFPKAWMAWALWLIHILSAILTGAILPGKALQPVTLSQTRSLTFSRSMEQAIKVLAKVCGWVILFRILLSFLDRWILWYFPTEIRVVLTGILELANGCLQLTKISSLPLRFCICSAILALGGVSVAMQTLSVTDSLGLGLYLPGKLLQCAISLLLCLLLFYPKYLPIAAIAALCTILLVKFKKSSGKTKKAIV